MVMLTCDIVIGGFSFKGINSLEIESSWENPTDTCKIIIPRKLEWEGKPLVSGLSPLLKRGEKVLISIGYDGNNHEVYRGYITDISAKMPTELTCEDDFWLLKRGEFVKTYKSVKLSALLKDLLGGIVKYEIAADRLLGSFRVSKATPAKVIEYLKEKYLVKGFFRDGVYYAGLAIVAKLQKTHRFNFEADRVDDDLVFKVKDDVKIQLEGIIKADKGKDEKVKVGDDDGEVRTFNYPPNTSKSAVVKSLNEHLDRLKYTGYRGSLTVFGFPMVHHGDLVTLYDPSYPEREGTYLVKKVNRTFGVQGYRQKLELEGKYK
jgi:hypothetical protein